MTQMTFYNQTDKIPTQSTSVLPILELYFRTTQVSRTVALAKQRISLHPDFFLRSDTIPLLSHRTCEQCW